MWMLSVLGIHQLNAQSVDKKMSEGLKFYMSKDSVSYVKVSVLGQFWARYNSNNPGSTVFGESQKAAYDFGIRRLRFSLTSQITNRFFFYTQVGLNNINTIAGRKQGLFIHDATAEVNAYKKYLTFGIGLNGWNGTSRYSSSSVGTILGMDLPTIEETTNDVMDQFGRKFGVYAKGKIGKVDYRFSVSKPFPVQTALSKVDELPLTEINRAYSSTRAPKVNTAGYVFYQFFDEESNQLPYMTGTYLGAKKILNVGAGFQFEKDAFWYHNNLLDTISAPLRQFGVDIFYDSYLNKEKGNAITAYVAYLNYFFGPNYIRNAGAMNMANGVNSLGSFNGTGNNAPLIGTGNVFYTQFGYKFKNNLLGTWGTLQPYAAASVALYQKLNDPVNIFTVGINWLMLKHHSKLSLDYQSRPLFYPDGNGHITESKSARRGQIVLQYQISI